MSKSHSLNLYALENSNEKFEIDVTLAAVDVKVSGDQTVVFHPPLKLIDATNGNIESVSDKLHSIDTAIAAETASRNAATVDSAAATALVQHNLNAYKDSNNLTVSTLDATITQNKAISDTNHTSDAAAIVTLDVRITDEENRAVNAENVLTTAIDDLVIPNLSMNPVAIGSLAGYTNQGYNTIAVGYQAGYSNQGSEGVAVGYRAGQTDQGARTVAIGNNTGKTTQGYSATAVGNGAGQTDQGGYCTALGVDAGRTNQGLSAVAIGNSAGNNNQGVRAVAIGNGAGRYQLPDDSIALGKDAGSAELTNGHSRTAAGFWIGTDCIRQDTTTSGLVALQYNPATGEITRA